MPRPRFFCSSTSADEWVSPLIVVARGLVAVGNCVPFPYVNTALSSGLALLELIQNVGKSGDDLKYLAESVVTIMRLLREEMDSQPTIPDTKFREVCAEFTVQKFHALKLGDIHLDFRTARTAIFTEMDLKSGKRRDIGWTDYSATVNGCVRTVRVYQGSEPTESWKNFLYFLADNSPSPRLRALVFHGEYLTLDEHAKTLPSAQGLVDWELNLVFDFLDWCQTNDFMDFFRSRRYAMVNAQDGKLVLSHIQPSINPSVLRQLHTPFLEWFSDPDLQMSVADKRHMFAGTEGHLRGVLEALVGLQRRHWIHPSMSIHTALMSRGCVYHRSEWPPVARLGCRAITPDDSWRVVYMIMHGRDSEDIDLEWPPDECFPATSHDSMEGFTHFVVPLMGKTRKWISAHDVKAHYGYFLNARIEFGKSVPDITHSWMAQASSILSTLERSKPSEFYVNGYLTHLEATSTGLELTWEMVLAAEDTPTTSESLAICQNLPEKIHVFVQVPTVQGDHIKEPQIYWSTDAGITNTLLIPRGALEIWMTWKTDIHAVRWEPHHYEVANIAQEQHGFDPTTNAATQSLDLPLLEVFQTQPPNRRDPGMCTAHKLDQYLDHSTEPDWHGKYTMDPHTQQAIPVCPRGIST
ncbi:hypothetical protein B0H13DRAFT_1889550 [Mycena leptocephala]|nr:hypothetical protein B0H13DRAFT_1889550 [Mycena leptocephala]